jgi:hypothetical protein
MYKAELELEKRLNDLALANVPSTSYENIVIVPKRKPAVSLEMSPDEFDLRDLALDQKMNTISNNAIVYRLGWKPSKIKSDVTKEMIQDYQLEQLKNIKDGVYIPASIDLDLLEEPDDPALLTDRQLVRVRADLKRATERVSILQEEQANLPRIYEEAIQQWESDQQTALAAAVNETSTVRARIRRDAQAELEELNRQFEEYKAQLQTRYAESEGIVVAISRLLGENQSNRSEYQRKVVEVQQENDKRRKIYEDTVLSMNRGINNIAMLPNETIDEYKQRLADIGDSTDNTDAVEAAASLLYSDRLREKMAEITRDEVVVGDFIRRLNTDQRYSVVKVFETFKKKVLEIFGQDNKFMSADDLFQVASDMADRVAIQAVNEPAMFKEAEAVPTFEAYAVEEGTAPELSPRKPYVFSKGFAKAVPTRMEALLAYIEGTPLPAFRGKLGVNQARFEAEVARIDEWKAGVVRDVPERAGPLDAFVRPVREEIPFEDLRTGVQRLAEELADEDQKQRLLNLLTFSEADLRRAIRVGGLTDDIAARRGTTGRGLHPKYPKILPFGLIEVSPHKLFYENVLKITRKGKHLTGFPNVKVSDAFVKFMFKIMDGGQPTMKEVNALSAGEKALFDSVVFTAGLAREVETTGSGVKQDLKNRLALIEGEIEAGNTNPELIKEARKILQHLARMKIIGHRPATEHLKMLIRAQRE